MMNFVKFSPLFSTLQLSQRTTNLYKPVCAPGLLLGDPPVRQMNRRARQRKKHYDIKWTKLRAAKIWKIDLPDFDEIKSKQKMSPEDRRADMKKEGRLPPRTFQERPINISSSSDVFEPYVPPEGDGKASFISKEGASQKAVGIQKKGKSMLEVRKIKKYDENFDESEFAQTALDIYKEAHHLLQDLKENETRLHDLVTEKAYPEMTYALDKKTFRWRFLESMEAPRVVHVRTNEMLTKGNLYGQVTVRLHTKQTLAIYDRFGRLMYGGENLVKDVLEYVVYEKHLANEYGIWRLHTKVVPEWMPPRQPAIRTYKQAPAEEETETEDAQVTEVAQTEPGPDVQATVS